MRLRLVPLNPGTLYDGSATGFTIAPSCIDDVFTACTSTPNSSGSVCAVTSYGRFGGPPGYSDKFGYACRSSRALAYEPNGCAVGTR